MSMMVGFKNKKDRQFSQSLNIKNMSAIIYYLFLPLPLQHGHVSEPPRTSWKYPLPEQYSHFFVDVSSVDLIVLISPSLKSFC
ncbi:hypothetical protein BSG1_14023 [Bacillus sp. SG-1]|nr:hypothetical protein BSG1_14023 [Bacillus sp. SG-1]